MPAPWLHNIPEAVSERLARLAARDGMSVSDFAVRELAEASKRADSPAILEGLPDVGVDPASTVADRDAGRTGR